MGVLPLGGFANVERVELAPRVEGGGRADMRGNRVSTIAQAVFFFFCLSGGIKDVPVPFLF